MLAIQRSTKTAEGCTLNILPCRIHHTGPTKVTKRYWAPLDGKGQQTKRSLRHLSSLTLLQIILRLRTFEEGSSKATSSSCQRLRLVCPFLVRTQEHHANCRFPGMMVKTTGRLLQQSRPVKTADNEDEDSDDDVQALDDIPEPVKILESTAEFKEVVIWGHDNIPGTHDAFVKGLEEWLAFANTIHQF
jgi:ribonuclease H2 subunit C